MDKKKKNAVNLLHHYQHQLLPTEMSEDKDSKTIQLLELLDRYQLLTTSNRDNFINGFFNLSRANFQNEKSRYGSDKFDLRSYQACKIVEQINDGEFQIIDRLEKNKITKKKVKSNDEEKSSLRNRKEKSKEDEINDTSGDDEEFKDPIRQFGALVPQELRISQNDFNKALVQSIEIINLQKKIEKLINELS